MANIQPDINKIKEAIYGEEVRDSIVNALTKMNTQAAAAQEWATGEDDPTKTPSATNNAAYYAAQAAASETNAGISESNASTSETNASLSETAAANAAVSAEANALKAEGMAVGEQNGTPVPSSDEQYYHNNAKFFKDQAASSAATALTRSRDAEAWAVGKRNNVDVPETDAASHNNSYFWAQQANNIVQPVVSDAIAAWLNDHPTALSNAVVLEKISSYDTEADMQSDTSLTAGQIVRTFGHTSLGDNGGCAYYISDSDVSGEINVLLSNTKYAVMIRPRVLTPEMFGAIGDGVTDDTVAIQRALNNMSSKSPILEFGEKTYIVNPASSPSIYHHVLVVPAIENAEIIGEPNTVIKLISGGGTYESIIGISCTNSIYIHDITFDHNCENNTFETESEYLTPGRYTLTHYRYSMCKCVKIENVTVLNCDSIVSFYFPGDRPNAAESVSITGCKFLDYQNVNTLSFSDFDQSTINAVATSLLISNNVFKGKSWSVSPRTAIEAHIKTSCIVTDNIIEQYSVAMNVCGGHYGVSTKSVVVANNTINVSRNGISLWSYRWKGDTEPQEIGIESLNVSNNSIYMEADKDAYPSNIFFSAIRFYGTANDKYEQLAFKNAEVIGNVITYAEDVGSDYASLATPNTWGAIDGVYSNYVYNKHIYSLLVSNNSILNCPLSAIVFDGITMSNAVISGNICKDCCTHYFTNPASGQSGRTKNGDNIMHFSVNLESDLNVINNTIQEYSANSKAHGYIYVQDTAAASPPKYYFNVYNNVFSISPDLTKAASDRYVPSPTMDTPVRFMGDFPRRYPTFPTQSSVNGARARMGNQTYVKTSTAPQYYWNSREEYATEPPVATGRSAGDVVYNTAPAPGGYFGWTTVTFNGATSWKPFGRITHQESGVAKNRPYSNLFDGCQYFSTTLKRLLIWDGAIWTYTDGTEVKDGTGASSSRPTGSNVYKGYQYYDTDLGKLIIWDGSDWVNVDGTALS